MRRPGSVQTFHVALDEIQDGVARMKSGPACAALEVRPINVALRPDVEQEAIEAGYAAALNALPGPLQVLIRTAPVDLEPAARALEERAPGLPPGLAALARDHAAFLRRLGRDQTLLTRRAYLVVPAEITPRAGWRRRGRREDAASRMAVDRQLAARCAELVRQLGRCGLTARRLEDAELAELHAACWRPERRRAERLRRDLDAYQTLVVHRSSSHREGKRP